MIALVLDAAAMLRASCISSNSMICSGSGGCMGLSFAVPINLAMRIAAQLRVDSGPLVRDASEAGTQQRCHRGPRRRGPAHDEALSPGRFQARPGADAPGRSVALLVSREQRLASVAVRIPTAGRGLR